MFLLDNFVIILLVSAALFVFFTFINIMTFSRDTLTAIYLTFIFFDLFIRMPFKVVNSTYQDREKLIKSLEKDKKITVESRKKLDYIFQKRTRIFMFLYRAGLFSYTSRMISMTSWYKNRPFRVRIKLLKQRKQSYETKYIRDMKKDLVSLEA